MSKLSEKEYWNHIGYVDGISGNPPKPQDHFRRKTTRRYMKGWKIGNRKWKRQG